MQTQLAGSRAQGPFGRGGGARILLAADDVPIRLTLEAVLQKSGYLVDSAASSAEAMEKIEAGQYDLILCNLRQESKDAGRNVLQVAHAQDYRPAAAMLAVSPESGEETEQRDEMLVEPVDVPRLLTQITELLASRAYGRAARSASRMSG